MKTTNNKLQNIYEEALKVNSKKASAIYQAGACGAITTEEVIKQLKQLQPEQEQKPRSLKCLANDAAKDIKGEQAAKAERKAEREAAREAKNRIEQARKAERERKAAEKAAKANAPKSAETLALESKVIEKASTKAKTRNAKKSA